MKYRYFFPENGHKLSSKLTKTLKSRGPNTSNFESAANTGFSRFSVFSGIQGFPESRSIAVFFDNFRVFQEVPRFMQSNEEWDTRASCLTGQRPDLEMTSVY